jgi:hypothetical protein
MGDKLLEQVNICVLQLREHCMLPSESAQHQQHCSTAVACVLTGHSVLAFVLPRFPASLSCSARPDPVHALLAGVQPQVHGKDPQQVSSKV